MSDYEQLWTMLVSSWIFGKEKLIIVLLSGVICVLFIIIVSIADIHVITNSDNAMNNVSSWIIYKERL